MPRSSSRETQQILVCNVGAGWNESIVNTSSFAGGSTFVSSIVKSNSRSSENRTLISQVSADYSQNDDEYSEVQEYVNEEIVDFELPLYPKRVVSISREWAVYLNPIFMILNITLINLLLPTFLDTGPTLVAAEAILSGLIVNGLARTFSASLLQGIIKTVEINQGFSIDGNYWFFGKEDMFIVDPIESENWVKFHVSTSINGFAYNTEDTTTRIAIGFLLVYCVLAISHVMYSGISGM